VHPVSLAAPDGNRSNAHHRHKTILAALELPEPPRFFNVTAPAPDPPREGV
jgi:hypothetical protein